MNITKACSADLVGIMEIVNEAKAYLKSQKINQWQDGYPNPDSFKEDLQNDRLYVLKEDNELLGQFVLVEKEPTYTVIDGKWLNDEPYVAVHRIAIKNERKGQNCAGFIFNYLKKQYANIRIDTHKENHSMRACLAKNGFKYCGVIILADGNPRNAYHWVKDI